MRSNVLLQQQRGQRPRRRVAHHNPTPAHDDAEEPDHDTEQILKRAEGRARAKLVTDALRGLNGVQPHPSPQHLVKGLNLKGHTDGPSGDLPAGAYRLSSINTAANHQPNLGPIAQHGSHGDMVYVSITSLLPSITQLAEIEHSSEVTKGRKNSSSLRARRRMEEEQM